MIIFAQALSDFFLPISCGCRMARSQGKGGGEDAKPKRRPPRRQLLPYSHDLIVFGDYLRAREDVGGDLSFGAYCKAKKKPTSHLTDVLDRLEYSLKAHLTTRGPSMKFLAVAKPGEKAPAPKIVRRPHLTPLGEQMGRIGQIVQACFEMTQPGVHQGYRLAGLNSVLAFANERRTWVRTAPPGPPRPRRGVADAISATPVDD